MKHQNNGRFGYKEHNKPGPLGGVEAPNFDVMSSILIPGAKENKMKGPYTIFPGEYINRMLLGGCEILDGLIKIVSLGFYSKGLALSYTGWRIRSYIKYLKKKEEKEKQNET